MSCIQPVIQPVQFAYASWSASTTVEWVSYVQSGVLGHILPGVTMQTKLSIFYVITTFVQKIFSKIFHFGCFIGSQISSKSKYLIQPYLPYHLSMRQTDLADIEQENPILSHLWRIPCRPGPCHQQTPSSSPIPLHRRTGGNLWNIQEIDCTSGAWLYEE